MAMAHGSAPLLYHDLWWKGVEEWYNNANFLAAMETWWEAIDLIRKGRTDVLSLLRKGDDFGINALEESWNDLFCCRSTSSVDSGDDHHDDASEWENEEHALWDVATADWLVFVAGCYLDARRPKDARICLGLSLRFVCPIWKDSSDSSTDTSRTNPQSTSAAEGAALVVTRALQEYMASYQEELDDSRTSRDDIESPSLDAAAAQNTPWMIAQRVVALTLCPDATKESNDQKGCDNNHDTSIVSTTTTDNCTTPWTNIYQRPAYWWKPPLSSEVHQAPAVIPTDEQPAWCRRLEEQAHVIQDELQQLLFPKGTANSKISSSSSSSSSSSFKTPRHWPKVGAGHHRDGAGDHDGTVVRHIRPIDETVAASKHQTDADNDTDHGDWRELVLFGAGARPELAPQTAALIRRHCHDDVVDLADNGAGEVILSVLAPHTHIKPHTASHNVRLTAHLGLFIPTTSTTTSNSGNNDDADCFIRVANQICHWERGKMLVFDDSYEHEVVNRTKEIRAVLLLRFWPSSIPRSDRHAALATIQAAKHNDEIRRCNPPLPPTPCIDANGRTTISTNMDAWVARYKHQTTCPSCWQSGYETMRVMAQQQDWTNGDYYEAVDYQQASNRLGQRSFACQCGEPIV